MLSNISSQLSKVVYKTATPIIPLTITLNPKNVKLRNWACFYHTRRRKNSDNYQRYYNNYNPYQEPIQYRYKRFNGNQRQNGRTLWQTLNDPLSRKYLYLIIGGGSLFYLTHLEEAPVSSRRRFIWIPRTIELAIGRYSYNSIL